MSDNRHPDVATFRAAIDVTLTVTPTTYADKLKSHMTFRFQLRENVSRPAGRGIIVRGSTVPGRRGCGMSKKHDKEQHRRKKLRDREQGKQPRTAVVHNDGKRTVVRQGSTKGYDVEMIRDFLAHLLLEVRVQNFEQQKWLRTLAATDDLDATTKAMEQPSENLVRQFTEFQKKYQSALIPTTVFDRENASPAESKDVAVAVVTAIRRKRDEQIGHLEALTDLFEEALRCARLPFGVDDKGNPIEAQRVYKVRELLDGAL